MIGLFGHIAGRLGLRRKGVTKTVTPVSPEAITEINDGIDRSLAERRASRAAREHAAEQGWQTRRAERLAADPLSSMFRRVR